MEDLKPLALDGSAHTESIAKLAAALAKAQGEMRCALKDSNNPHLRTKYADLVAIQEAWKEVGPKNGMAIVQVAESHTGRVDIKTILAHESGEWISGLLSVPYAEQKGINIAQAMGSAITYGRRYALAAMVGIASDDDDGHSAAAIANQKQDKPATNGTHKPAGPLKITRQEWEELKAAFLACDLDPAKILTHYGAAKVGDLTHDQATEAAALAKSQPELFRTVKEPEPEGVAF